MSQEPEIKYLTPIVLDKKIVKYCRFKKKSISFIDYKDGDFLKMLLNPQGRVMPRRITGTSMKYQSKVAQAIKRARHLAILPFVTDNLDNTNNKK